MPGGSVNGRPFRESSDAYSRTGIPCGNPRRFHSQDVVRMEPGARTRPRPIDGPLEEIETAGQRQLQAILHKQLDTNITLKQQLGQKRTFTKGAEFSPITEELTGTRSLNDFKTLGDVDAYIEEMKSYGLTHDEILYKLRADDKSEKSDKKSRLSNPEFHEAKLREIEDKIATKKLQLSQPDTFSNVKPLSRHEMDLEKAISTANIQNTFLHSTLIKQKQNISSTSHTHPMNSIPDILESLTKNTTARRHKHKKTDPSYKGECTLECCAPVEKVGCSQCSSQDKNSTNMSHDYDVRSHCHKHKSCDHEPIIVTCMERPTDYVSKDEKEKSKRLEKKIPVKSTSFIVKTNTRTNSDNETNRNNTPVSDTEDSGYMRVLDNIQPVPIDVIRRYKLSSDEVKKIPRFENYTPGEANNVLFIKNLSLKVSEVDLASLFINYQQEDKNSLVFKLLNGKMKGQAFVTFPDVDTASKALELVHGYEFKGKPIIVQYGKKQVTSVKPQ